MEGEILEVITNADKKIISLRNQTLTRTVIMIFPIAITFGKLNQSG